MRNDMNNIIDQIRQELKEALNDKTQRTSQNF